MADHDRAERLRLAIAAKKTGRVRAHDIAPRPASEPARLSELQRSVWLAHQLDPRSPAYNLASAFRVHGPLDVARLEHAFAQLVSRHRILRSTFEPDRDGVRQVIHPHQATPIDVRQVAAGRAMPEATEEARRAFDLERAPLIRLRVFEEPCGRERLVLLVLHHLLADEASLRTLWREIADAYFDRDHAASPPLQFDDYAHWLSLQDGSQRERDLAFWRRRLTPVPEDLRLPFETAAPEGGAPAGRLLRRGLGSAVPAAIRRLAVATGNSPFAVYAFAFRLLLHRYTGGQPVAFATPVSTRAHPSAADTIGYFLNPVVLAARLDEALPVESAARAFGQDLREALAHASLPFSDLAAQLPLPRQRDRHPIFQAMFVHQDPAEDVQLGDARLEPLALDLGASKFDLTLFVAAREDPLEIAVEYRTDRFADLWMEGLLDHYSALLEDLPRDGGRRTADVSMLSGAERERLDAWSRGPDLDAHGIALLPHQILDRARAAPASPAIICGGERLDYAALERSASAVALALSDAGVGPGDRVGVFLDRSALMIAAVVGCGWAGAAYVPLDPGYPQARNHGALEDAAVSAVLTTTALRGRVPPGAWPVVDVDRLAAGSARVSGLPPLSSESPAYVLYTSGSTGEPKGVVVSHGNLRASTQARLQFYDRRPERFLLVPSVAFDSSVAGIFWTLALGCALVVPTDAEVADPRELARLVAREQVTSLLCVPSLYAQLLAAGGGHLAGLESVIVAGESCPARLIGDHVRMLPGVRIFNEYGPTEGTVWATVHEAAPGDAGGPVPIGRPIPGVRVHVLDALGRPLPAGLPGQAWIAGPTVAQGYWRRPEITADRFETAGTSEPEGRRYRTGDRVAWTTGGRLLFFGRDDEQIKLRGFRIEPGEIEAALLEQPGITRAAVVARTLDGAAGPAPEHLVAFVEGRADTAVHDWRPALAARVPDHLIPSRLVTLAGLPALPNGKIDRHRLKTMTLAPEVRAAGRDEPPTAVASALVSLWEGLLGRTGIRITDNFFELGGHSLLVVQTALAIERDFEVRLSPADVFATPTARELARRIEQRRDPGGPVYRHLFPIQPAGRRLPFIVAVPHFFSGMFAARFRGERPVYGLRGVSLRPEGNYGRWQTMTDLGEDLVQEVQRRFPGERCILAGYSFGATMAFEAARIMEERGVAVHRLYLIAPMPVDIYRFGPFRLQLDGLRQPLGELSPGEALRRYLRSNNPLTPSPYARAWRRLGIEPWRRMLCVAGALRQRAGLPLTPRILWADVRVERFRLHSRYRPRPVQAPAVIFNAVGTGTDAAATWRPFFRGPLTVHDIPDPHDEASVEAAREAILLQLGDMGDA